MKKHKRQNKLYKIRFLKSILATAIRITHSLYFELQHSLYFYGMKTVSLKIDNDIFRETEEILAKVKKPGNRYINEALAYYNRQQQRMYLILIQGISQKNINII